jgi:hypothetical protein
VPYRAVEEARARGAFAEWPATARLVAPFPSMTSVSFAELFRPFSAAPSDGYELRHFDLARNAVVGNPLRPRRHGGSWKTCCDVAFQALAAKVAMYGTPRWTGRLEVAAAETAVLGSATDPIVAYVGSTDGLAHMYGDEAMVGFLLELDASLRRLARRHREVHRRALRVVMFSDHGMGRVRVRSVGDVSGALRRAGLRVVRRLRDPDDVVASTFGVVGYGALFVAPGLAEAAAQGIVGHEGVELAAWSPEPFAVDVVSRDGRARVRWREEGARRRFAYECAGVDPLRLDEVRRAMTARLDADGFAGDRDWLAATADGYYPDALQRLADAFAGDRVRSRAPVLFSLAPGQAWGWRSAHVAARFAGGRIEGTHGGLDRDSSLGFLLTDDAAAPPRAVVRASEALAPFLVA